jgi:hypothetical protein
MAQRRIASGHPRRGTIQVESPVRGLEEWGKQLEGELEERYYKATRAAHQRYKAAAAELVELLQDDRGGCVESVRLAKLLEATSAYVDQWELGTSREEDVVF